ncbi:hypothetical protein TRFO_37143 [Tritrichomonas foetus]|uniref:Centromere protein J C-terminal domain-containing protein n=1 Tax=Tritrichomonas foetus TaxID=1144522 RepID=A0A1J4JBT1_9EUKA|nr:hypothetical protein TRFO_37143 [Tritrichomonas foetus]|eukprot:OHS96646.1 hypothetical protein TRFO_37143 [Tritrichomonas foetus]
MENDEAIDFEALSKEYPLFFSPANQKSLGEIFPAKATPQPTTFQENDINNPKLFLNYEDYMLDDQISKLSPYNITDKSKRKTDIVSSIEYSLNKFRSPPPSNKTRVSSSKKVLPAKNSNSSKNKSNDFNSNQNPKNTKLSLNSPQNVSTNKSEHSNLSPRSNIKSSPTLDNNSQKDAHKNVQCNGPNNEAQNLPEKKCLQLQPIDIPKTLAKEHKEAGVQTPKSLSKKKFNIPPPPPPPLLNGYHIMFDYEPKNPQRRQTLSSGIEKVFYLNGDVSVHYKSGKVKIRHQNTTLTKFTNGDVLQEFLDGTTAYRYSQSGTVELKLPDNTTILEFADGQREKRTPDGEVTVNFGSGIFMKVDSKGQWTMVHSNTHENDNNKIVLFEKEKINE